MCIYSPCAYGCVSTCTCVYICERACLYLCACEYLSVVERVSKWAGVSENMCVCVRDVCMYVCCLVTGCISRLRRW